MSLVAAGTGHCGASEAAQRALAGAFVNEAVKRCGHEATQAGAALLAPNAVSGAPTDTSARFVGQLWQKTWECEPAFVGRSCTAARWALCERVYLEYGPQGAVMPDLLKPIIHK